MHVSPTDTKALPIADLTPERIEHLAARIERGPLEPPETTPALGKAG